MNVPVGTPQIKGKPLRSDQIVADVRDMLESNKCGYFCVTIKGETGMEEGLLIIESGNIIGAHYEYMKYGKEYHASEALKRVLNAFFADKGIYDSFVLTTQQIELLKIFNEDLLLLESVSKRSFDGMIPVGFSHEFEKEVISEFTKEPEREEILKKRGLTDIKIDLTEDVERETKDLVKTTDVGEKVADEIDAYLSGKTEKVIQGEIG